MNTFFGQRYVHPFVGLDYFFVNHDGFTESGADSVNLHVESKDAQFIRFEIGGAVARKLCTCYGILIPEISLSYVYFKPIGETGIDARFVSIPTEFTVFTTDEAVNAVAPSAALTLRPNDCYCIALQYEGEYSRSRRENQLSLNYRLKF